MLVSSSNHVPDDAALIPKPSQFALQGLTDLQDSVLKRGMLNEAFGLYKVERRVLERADAVLSLRGSYRDPGFGDRRAFCLASGVEILHIYLAQSLHERHEVENGETGISQSRLVSRIKLARPEDLNSAPWK